MTGLKTNCFIESATPSPEPETPLRRSATRSAVLNGTGTRRDTRVEPLLQATVQDSVLGDYPISPVSKEISRHWLIRKCPWLRLHESVKQAVTIRPPKKLR